MSESENRKSGAATYNGPPRIEYLLDLYRTMSTAQIARKVGCVTEASVYNVVFGHRQSIQREVKP